MGGRKRRERRGDRWGAGDPGGGDREGGGGLGGGGGGGGAGNRKWIGGSSGAGVGSGWGVCRQRIWRWNGRNRIRARRRERRGQRWRRNWIWRRASRRPDGKRGIWERAFRRTSYGDFTGADGVWEGRHHAKRRSCGCRVPGSREQPARSLAEPAAERARGDGRAREEQEAGPGRAGAVGGAPVDQVCVGAVRTRRN